MGTKFMFLNKSADVDLSNQTALNNANNFNIIGNRHVQNDVNNSNNINGFNNNDSSSVTYVRRLHIGTNRVNTTELITQTLQLYRKKCKYVTEGLKLDLNGIIAIIIKCDPVGGYLSEDTIFYVEEGLKPVNKIQLLWNIKNCNRLKQYIQLLLDKPNDRINTPNTSSNQPNGKTNHKSSLNKEDAAIDGSNQVDTDLNVCLDTIIDELSSGSVYYGPFKIRRINLNYRANSGLKLSLLSTKASGIISDTPINSAITKNPINCGNNVVPNGVNNITASHNEDGKIQEYNAAIHSVFANLFYKYLIRLLEIPRFYFYGNCQVIGDLTFFTSLIDPINKPGYIDENTEIYLGFDPFDTFDRITVSPLKDTLPVNYKYNLLEDCVKPFFRLNSFRLYRLGDVFYFSGIQFRITDLSQNKFGHSDEDSQLGDYGLFMKWNRLLTCPKYGRVNRNTKIEIGAPVNTKLMDLLPVERIEILRRSAPCYRENLLICFASDLDLNSLDRIYSNNSPSNSLNNSLNSNLTSSLNNSFGGSLNTSGCYGSLGNSLADARNESVWEPNRQRRSTMDYYEDSAPQHDPVVNRRADMSSTGATNMDVGSVVTSGANGTTNASGINGTGGSNIKREICTVCCELIGPNNLPELKRLNCGHVFHRRCVLNWLKTNKSCPNCRRSLSTNYTLNSRDGIDASVRRHNTPVSNGGSSCSATPTALHDEDARINSIWTESTTDNTPNSFDAPLSNNRTITHVSLDSGASHSTFSSRNSLDYYWASDPHTCSPKENVNDIFNQYEAFETDRIGALNPSNRSSIEDNFYFSWNSDDPTNSSHSKHINRTDLNSPLLNDTDSLVNWRIMVSNTMKPDHAPFNFNSLDNSANSRPGLTIYELDSGDDSGSEQSDLESYFSQLTS